MNPYLEIFGYIGTILVVISMMMPTMFKLRIVNITGAIISTIYSFIIVAYPIAVMNICLIIIHIYHLLKEFKKKAI